MRVSVVIPTLNEAPRIGALLARLAAMGFNDIIVADGASSDGTLRVARDFGARIVSANACRGAQLHAGAQAASGEAIWFLHADSTPPDDCKALIAGALADRRVAAGCFRLAFDRKHSLLWLLARLSALNLTLTTYGDQGLFVRGDVYREIGGFKPLPILEDLEIQQRLRRRGRFVKLSTPIVTSARRYLRDGVLRRQAMNVAIVALYAAGVSPWRLWRWYRPEPPDAS